MNELTDIFYKERERWFLWLPVLFAVGIGIYFYLPAEPSKWITLTVIEVLLFLAYLFRFYPFLLKIIFLIGVIVIGFADVQLKTISLEKKLPTPPEGTIYIRGQILSADTNYRGRPRIVLGNMENFHNDKIMGQYRLTVIRKNQPIEVGKCVELVAEVSPIMKANQVGGYQPDRRLFFDGINGSGYVPTSVFEIDCHKDFGYFKRLIDKWRKRMTDTISSHLPSEQAAIISAVLAGNRDFMPQEQIENYRDSGLAHFLSISGLHMSMLAGLMFFFVRFFMALIPALSLRYNSKKVAAVLAFVVSTVYLLVSGAEVPTQRAYIMTFMVLLAVIFERQAISMRILAIAALIILIISPQALVNISFQLSFAAVVALVAFYERFGGKVERFLSGENKSLSIKILRGVIAYMIGIVLADLIASLATLPYAIYHFNRVSLYTSITNFIAGPIIGLIIMPAILIALLTIPLGLAKIPLKFAGLGVEQLNKLTEYVSSLPNATIELYSFPLWGLLLITFGGLWLCLWQQKWRHFGWIAIFVGALSIMTVQVPDLMVASDGKTIAVKNENGKLQAFKGGNKWIKQNWLSKYASSNIKETDDKDKIKIPNVDYVQTQGFAVYGNKIKTVRDYIGHRPWNK